MPADFKGSSQCREVDEIRFILCVIRHCRPAPPPPKLFCVRINLCICVILHESLGKRMLVTDSEGLGRRESEGGCGVSPLAHSLHTHTPKRQMVSVIKQCL